MYRGIKYLCLESKRKRRALCKKSSSIDRYSEAVTQNHVAQKEGHLKGTTLIQPWNFSLFLLLENFLSQLVPKVGMSGFQIHINYLENTNCPRKQFMGLEIWRHINDTSWQRGPCHWWPMGATAALTWGCGAFAKLRLWPPVNKYRIQMERVHQLVC